MLFLFISFSILEFLYDNIDHYDKSKMFKLRQRKHKKYDNITQCLTAEYKQNDATYINEVNELYKNFHPDSYFDNLSSLLVNPQNDLTFDEKFAIYVFSQTNISLDQNPSLRIGGTFQFDCYIGYLESALKKLKPLPNNNKIQLYSGTTAEYLATNLKPISFNLLINLST